MPAKIMQNNTINLNYQQCKAPTMCYTYNHCNKCYKYAVGPLEINGPLETETRNNNGTK